MSISYEKKYIKYKQKYNDLKRSLEEIDANLKKNRAVNTDYQKIIDKLHEPQIVLSIDLVKKIHNKFYLDTLQLEVLGGEDSHILEDLLTNIFLSNIVDGKLNDSQIKSIAEVLKLMIGDGSGRWYA